jgi:hypothetical protein
MAFLVFDIETSALPFDDFDPVRQEYLLRGCKDDAEREDRIRMMSLNPLTAQVVAIGMLYVAAHDAEPKGYIYSNCGAAEPDDTLSDGTFWRKMSERDMLAKWWDALSGNRAHDRLHLISFNGRSFDCPFLMLRSAALKVRPTRNLMDGTRWRWDAHTDLQEELAFRSSDRTGAMRRFNFDFYCKSFGITSPKSEQIAGDKVPEFFRAGDHRTIAEYCMRDVRATWELFKVWKDYLADVESY